LSVQGFSVQGFSVQCSVFSVQCSVFSVQGFRVQGFSVQCSVFRVQGHPRAVHASTLEQTLTRGSMVPAMVRGVDSTSSAPRHLHGCHPATQRAQSPPPLAFVGQGYSVSSPGIRVGSRPSRGQVPSARFRIQTKGSRVLGLRFTISMRGAVQNISGD